MENRVQNYAKLSILSQMNEPFMSAIILLREKWNIQPTYGGVPYEKIDQFLTELINISHEKLRSKEFSKIRKEYQKISLLPMDDDRKRDIGWLLFSDIPLVSFTNDIVKMLKEFGLEHFWHKSLVTLLIANTIEPPLQRSKDVPSEKQVWHYVTYLMDFNKTLTNAFIKCGYKNFLDSENDSLSTNIDIVDMLYGDSESLSDSEISDHDRKGLNNVKQWKHRSKLLRTPLSPLYAFSLKELFKK